MNYSDLTDSISWTFCERSYLLDEILLSLLLLNAILLLFWPYISEDSLGLKYFLFSFFLWVEGVKLKVPVKLYYLSALLNFIWLFFLSKNISPDFFIMFDKFDDPSLCSGTFIFVANLCVYGSS